MKMLEVDPLSDSEESRLYRIKSPTEFVKVLRIFSKEYNIKVDKKSDEIYDVYYNEELLLCYSKYVNMTRIPRKSKFHVMLRKIKLDSF
jgi:hypothetical protein